MEQYMSSMVIGTIALVMVQPSLDDDTYKGLSSVHKAAEGGNVRQFGKCWQFLTEGGGLTKIELKGLRSAKDVWKGHNLSNVQSVPRLPLVIDSDWVD